ncbi:MAG: CehA/McbA family metallohydrolase [Lachnotalea sp.]
MKMQKNIKIQNQLELAHFHVQKPITSLLVSVVMEGDEYALILVYNPNNIVCGFISKELSHFLDEFYISDNCCTLNGLRHELVEGMYTVAIISIHSVEKKNLEINFDIEMDIIKEYDESYCQKTESQIAPSFDEILEETHRYYKGDFHGHTIYSDGNNTRLEANEILKQQQMDFMAFTEHNSIPLTQGNTPCLSIPSFELTLPTGHINVHGIKDMNTIFLKLQTSNILNSNLSEKELFQLICDMTVECYSGEANLSLNHMFLKPWHFNYENFDMSKLNTIEIICDPTYATSEEANDKAVAFLDFLWEEGLLIYGIGGSDSHNKQEERYEGAVEPSIYGDPATYVFCKGLSIRNIVDAVKKGHAYVARYVTMDICICEGKYLPGDEVEAVGEVFTSDINKTGKELKEELITYEVHIDSNKILNRELVGRFILNNQIVKEIRLNKEQDKIYDTVSFRMENNPGSWWLRFGIYDKAGHVIAYVNPIYRNKKACNASEFKILKEKFGE